VRLRRRLGLVGASYVVLMVLGGISALLAATARADNAETERALTVGAQRALALRTAYLNMETSQRGFVITGNDAFLEPFDEGRSATRQLEDDLRSLTHDNASLAYDVAGTLERGRRWIEEAALPAITSRRTNPSYSPDEAASATGKALFDELRASLDRVQQDLDLRAAAADHRRERAAGVMTVLVVLVPVIGIVVTIIAGMLLSSWVLRPIDEMVGALRRSRSGDVAGAVPASGAPDVAELGLSIDEMRRTIEQQRDDAVRRREAVEQNAVLALWVRDELAADIGELPTGWTGAAALLPAEGVVAGDCYDVSLISPARLAVAVIDIAGHGGAPALIALKCKEILRASLRAQMTPGAALRHLAGQVGDLEGSFLTAFVATIDTATGALRYASAGHPPALLAHDGALEELMPTGPLLGPFASDWMTVDRQITLGGQLAIYTDGLVEARHADRSFYGMERLAAVMLSVPCVDAQPVVEACFADLKTFSPERLVDDVTMVILCRDCPEDEPDEQASADGLRVV
jgi:serine phosphatase RsbU (regulator of sigma subunit)/CHASE3 domain sensor protein